MNTTIQKIKKRDGNLQEFDVSKIVSAVQRAFQETHGNFDTEKISLLAERVVSNLEMFFSTETPRVEVVQDFVERELMHEGHFDVAKAYILYRYEHTKGREEEEKETEVKIETNSLTVTKRSGAVENFSSEKLKKSLSYVLKGFENEVDGDAILTQCRSELYDGIKTSDIGRSLIMTIRTMIEQDPAYSKIAARLLLAANYKEVIGEDKIDYTKLETQYREAFIKNIKRGVNIERIDPKLLTFDLEKLANALVIDRDDFFVYLGIQTLNDRYFLSDHDTKKVLETPQAFWMRIAMGSALLEKKNKDEYAIQFYEIMSKLLYTPSTPTLFHAGTVKPQLSSCYLNTVTDSLDNIFKTYSDNAQLSKWSGGIGMVGTS